MLTAAIGEHFTAGIFKPILVWEFYSSPITA